MGPLKRAAGCGNETLGGVFHIHKTHITGEGNGVGLTYLGGHQCDGGCRAHALVTPRPVNNGGTNTNAWHAPVLPVHAGHLLAADLVRAVKCRQPVIVSHGRRRNRAGIAHSRDAALPGKLQHMNAAHHINVRAANGVGLAKGHLQRGEVNNRLDVVRLCHLKQALKIRDVAQLPDDDLRAGHDQIKALAILGDIEHHGGGTQLS